MPAQKWTRDHDLIDWMLCRKREGGHPCVEGDCGHEDDRICVWTLLKAYNAERGAVTA